MFLRVDLDESLIERLRVMVIRKYASQKGISALVSKYLEEGLREDEANEYREPLQKFHGDTLGERIYARK